MTNTILVLLLIGICVSIPLGILLVAVVFSIRSRLRYADRIWKAQARGAFEDMGTPENRSRFRRLAIFALIGVLGMPVSLAVLVLQMATKFSSHYEVTIIVGMVFGIIAAVAGLLMQREINRRL